jgi:hypothetical protein
VIGCIHPEWSSWLARNWISVMNPSQNPPDWGIPATQITEFTAIFNKSEAALKKAQSETERTPVVTVQCNAAFKALTDKMRFIKKHYFLVPPLTEADLAALGLKAGGASHTEIPRPNGQVTADVGYLAAHMIELSNFRALGAPSSDPRSDYGVSVKIGIVGGIEPYHIDAPLPPGMPGLFGELGENPVHQPGPGKRQRRRRLFLPGHHRYHSVSGWKFDPKRPDMVR